MRRRTGACADTVAGALPAPANPKPTAATPRATKSRRLVAPLLNVGPGSQQPQREKNLPRLFRSFMAFLHTLFSAATVAWFGAAGQAAVVPRVAPAGWRLQRIISDGPIIGLRRIPQSLSCRICLTPGTLALFGDEAAVI